MPGRGERGEGRGERGEGRGERGERKYNECLCSFKCAFIVDRKKKQSIKSLLVLLNEYAIPRVWLPF